MLFFLSCTHQTKELPPADTKILGHRGSGATSISDYQENTYTSVKNAFQKLDGAEVDIQCSKDGTIWLFHDAGLPENEQGLSCIPQSYDQDLIDLANHDTLFRFSKLEKIFVMMSEMEKKPYISLDVKGHFPNGCFEGDNAPRQYFDMIVHGLSDLLGKYKLRDYVMVETNYQYFLDEIHEKEPHIERYLLGYEDFEKVMDAAISKAYDGISYKFNDPGLSKQNIKYARKNGLKIQLWTLYSENDFERIFNWGPDFIQTGNVELGENFITNSAEQ